MPGLRVYVLLICLKFCHGKVIDYNIFNSPVAFSNALQDFLVQNTSRLSLECKDQLSRYAHGLLSNELWSLKLYDANGKPPSGILSGNLYGLGNFDQCLDVKQTFDDRKAIYGKYCLESLDSLHKTSKKYALAICTPHECSSEEIRQFYQNNNITLSFSDDSCHSKLTQTELDIGAVATIIFLVVIFVFVVIATIFDARFHNADKSKLIYKICSSASTLANGKKLIKCGDDPNQITCLYGIRFLSLIWVVMVHVFLLFKEIPVYNMMEEQELNRKFIRAPIVSQVLTVDPFLLMAGITVAYRFMIHTKKGIKFDIMSHYLHRFIRLTPVLAVVVLIYCTLLKHFGSGPVWNLLGDTICYNHWWDTLLYIQNYTIGSIMCIRVSWYLSVDTQLYILSPLLLLPLKKWPKFSLSCSALLAVLSTVAAFLSIWIYDINVVALNFNDFHAVESSRFLNYYYIATHTRAAPWFLGVILGYLLFHVQINHKSVRIPKFLVAAAWIVCIVMMVCCIYSVHIIIVNDYNKLQHSLYGSLSHLGFTLSLCWIIFACVTGYGGPINWFLSLPFFEVLSRFSFTTYLIHDLIITIVGKRTRVAVEYSDIHIFYFICGTFMLSLVAATILTLIIELPFLGIEKVIWHRKRS